MDKMKWIIFTVLVVGIFGGIILLTKNNKTSFNGDATRPITENVAIGDHVYGSKDNKVVLIEYGDYQCPGCRAMHPTVGKLKEQYKDKLTFIFRHMPLTSIHPNALAAATVAEAAGLQGKFYEMSDVLYQNQDNWKGAPIDQRTAVFEGYASALGLNMDKFKNDLTNSGISEKINRDRATSRQFGADQTPTFVLNGKKLDSKASLSEEELLKAVETELKNVYSDFTPSAQTDADVAKPEGQ